MKIVISSGHGKYVRGAEGYLDEVDEARRVVEQTAAYLRDAGIQVTTYHDDVSKSQSENLDRIVDFHNAQTRDLDISVHFNAYEDTSKSMGTEVLWVTQEELAREVSEAIADAGDFIDRGPKYRDNLAFLNNTEKPSILIETCFVDSSADAENYRNNFDVICEAIAESIGGVPIEPSVPDLPGRPARPERPERPEPPEPEDEVLFSTVGTCSWFGGPEDDGVSPSEGLAFIFDIMDAPHLFLPYQPEDTSGLARRLNPYVHFIACRWDYDVTSKEMLRESGQVALVRVRGTNRALTAIPADWGPHEEQTGRAADLSKSLMDDLGITTDDVVEVIYPWRG
jgi:N-acetylmuramoyl-L-alanine amidase